ncbi:MAG TPA: hypothetical protein VKT24_06965 [Rhizomicrobium sp.]|nr:hypothetical protein [Rhizomicrobium sp.]
MRLFLFGAAALMAVASAASAGDDMMANTYGNTLVSVSSSGMESHTYYNADHTFSGKVPSFGFEYKGTWTIDDKGQLCRTFDPPVPGRTNPDCGPLASHAVGDKWTAADGATITLVQGVN